MANYPPIPDLMDPNLVKPQDAGDRKFVEHVYATQKTSISNNEALFQKIINGMPEVNKWNETQKAGNPARIIKKFLEQYATPGRDYQSAMILYPRILRVISLDEIDMQLLLAAQFERGFISAQQQISTLRDLNFSIIVDYFKRRAQSPRSVPQEHESAPGNLLTGGNYAAVPDYTRLSAEHAIINQANKLMRQYGLEPYRFNLFRRDVLYVACDEHKLIRQLYDKLYLSCVNDFIPHEEVIFAYRVLADAFEQFVRALVKKQVKLGSILDKFDQEHPIRPDRRQKRERILALIELFEKIIEKNEKSETLNSLIPLMNAVRALITELDKKFNKLAEAAIQKRTRELIEQITVRGKKNHEFTAVDPAAVFNDAVFNDPDYTRKHSQTVLNKLKDVQELCWSARDGSEGSAILFAPATYLYRIEAEAHLKKQKDKIALVEKMIQDLAVVRPKITSYRRHLKENDAKAHDEAVQIFANLKQSEGRQQKAEQEQKQTFDRLLCVSGGVMGAAIALGIYAALADFNVAVAAAIGLSAFALTYWLSLTGLERVKKIQDSREQNPRTAQSKSPPPQKEDPAFLKELEHIFPKTGDVLARVYTPKKLMARIKELERIRSINDDEKVKAAIRDFQKPLMRHVVLIKIPENRLPPNYSSLIFIGRADFRSKETRQKIASYFKAEADKNRQKQFNEAIVDYYLFIASEIEFNFARYMK